MGFRFSDQHIEEFRRQGFTVFRGILPPALIEDLRRVCERGRDIVREKSGNPDAQRFQPVSAFEIDQEPFEDYRDLPELRDAISRVLSPEHRHGDLSNLGVLLEPGDNPWCTAWHRDWRDNMEALELASWDAVQNDYDLFNQINGALYEDSCTWVVPGSHNRRDTPEEAELFPSRPISRPELEGKSAAERERVSLDYCQRMPGAQRLLLDAGDLALYRNTLWHLGNYIPYRRRATLHDSAITPRFRQWRETALASMQERKARGLSWENPNIRADNLSLTLS